MRTGSVEEILHKLRYPLIHALSYGMRLTGEDNCGKEDGGVLKHFALSINRVWDDDEVGMIGPSGGRLSPLLLQSKVRI